MEYMHELKDMLCDELEKIVDKGELTAGSLDTIDKLTHSIKSVATIMAMEESGYSNDDGNMTMRGGYRGNSYARNSYAQRRDSMGRYSRRGYSRDDERDKMVDKLEKMMEKTKDMEAKNAIREAIETLEM